MGNRRNRTDTIHSRTLPCSPSHSSSSDFEFSVPVSPRKSCPADELFYKGQIFPLHLPPRVSMVRSLLLSSSTGARHSTGSSSFADSYTSDLSHLAVGIDASCDSSRPSSVADGDSDLLAGKISAPAANKYSSLSRFSNAFKKDPKSGRKPGRIGSRKLEVIRKYLRKVKPFYEKLSHKKQQRCTAKTTSLVSSAETASFCSKSSATLSVRVDAEIKARSKGNNGNYSGKMSQPLWGNFNHLRKTRRTCVASCPSSMRSSPTHSGPGLPTKTRFTGRVGVGTTSCGTHNPDNSSMVELQSAIQGAIAHCKNSMRSVKSVGD